MSSLVILISLAVVSFILAYVTKRRFGVLALGLAAGSILAHLWVGDLTPIVADAGIDMIQPPLESVVAATITVTPALLLLLSGPVYRSGIWRAVGGLIFAILVVTFLLDSFGSALVIEDPGKSVYDFLVDNRTLIISAGLILGLFDVFATKSAKRSK